MRTATISATAPLPDGGPDTAPLRDGHEVFPRHHALRHLGDGVGDLGDRKHRHAVVAPSSLQAPASLWLPRQRGPGGNTRRRQLRSVRKQSEMSRVDAERIVEGLLMPTHLVLVALHHLRVRRLRRHVDDLALLQEPFALPFLDGTLDGLSIRLLHGHDDPLELGVGSDNFRSRVCHVRGAGGEERRTFLRQQPLRRAFIRQLDCAATKRPIKECFYQEVVIDVKQTPMEVDFKIAMTS